MWGSVKTYDNRLTLGDATALSTLVETSCLTDIYTEGRARFESLVESMDEIRSAVAVEVAAEKARASGSGGQLGRTLVGVSCV